MICGLIVEFFLNKVPEIVVRGVVAECPDSNAGQIGLFDKLVLVFEGLGVFKPDLLVVVVFLVD